MKKYILTSCLAEEEVQEYAQKNLVENEADFGGLKVIDYHKLGLDIDYEFVFFRCYGGNSVGVGCGRWVYVG